MESIQGLVEHIVYHNDTNGYTVFSLMCQGEEIVCVGNVTSLDEGEYLKAEGEYTEHQVYGRQFKVTSMSVEVPEDEYSIERYLGSGAIRGVGPSLAARIVKKFKKDSFRIIEEEPERLAEIKGISERKAREIYQQFHEKQDMRQAMMFLAKYGITTTLSLRIYKQYGEEMYRIIQENPYRLADDMNGIGFKLADEIAKKAGIGSHSDFRIRSGIIYMLQQGTLSGHIYIPAALLVEKTAQMLGVEEEAVDHLLQSLQMDRKIVVKKIDDVSVVYGASLYRLELETGDLSEKIERGKNTTRRSELIPLPGGGMVLDTPGFSLLDNELFDPVELQDSYPEFEPYLGSCYFQPCYHATEPKCGVRQAVEAGEIDELRHRRYVELLEDMKQKWRERYD